MLPPPFTPHATAKKLNAAFITLHFSGDGSDATEVQYEPGFRLGVEKDGKMYVNNHLKLIMSYHKTPPSSEGGKDNYRVVGFRVETGSVDHRCDHC